MALKLQLMLLLLAAVLLPALAAPEGSSSNGLSGIWLPLEGMSNPLPTIPAGDNLTCSFDNKNFKIPHNASLIPAYLWLSVNQLWQKDNGKFWSGPDQSGDSGKGEDPSGQPNLCERVACNLGVAIKVCLSHENDPVPKITMRQLAEIVLRMMQVCKDQAPPLMLPPARLFIEGLYVWYYAGAIECSWAADLAW